MSRFSSRAFFIFSAITLLWCIASCRVLVPAPPTEPPVKTEAKEAYDEDIPEQFIQQLKSAAARRDEAMPHIYLYVGMHFEAAGNEARSAHFFERALGEFRRLQNLYGEGTILNRRIFNLCEFGKMQDAYNAIKDAEKIWRNTPLNAFVYHNYGHYYLKSGDYDKAIDYFRKSLRTNTDYRHDFNLLMLRRDSELECGMAVILADYHPAMSRKFKFLDFDETFFSAIRKNVDEGIFHLRQVIALNDEIRRTNIGKYIPDKVYQITDTGVFNFLGLSYGIKGHFSEAMKHLDKSAEFARKADFQLGSVDNLFFRSLICLLDKNIKEGLNVSRQFNDLAGKYSLPFYSITAKFILAHFSRSIGDNGSAINLLNEAVDIMEKQRSKAEVEETSLFNAQTVYETLIDVLAGEGDYKKAFEIAERAKSKEINDLLINRDIGRSYNESELIKNDRQYLSSIAESYRKLLAKFSGNDLALKRKLASLREKEKEHLALLAKIEEQNEELHSLLTIQPVNNDDIRRLLDKNTTLFSYYVSDKILFIWAVNKDRVHLEKIKISREDVHKTVAAFNVAISSRNRRQVEAISQKVYETFLKPVIPFVSGDWIGFIPHGPLHYLPFAAMNYRGQYLVDVFSVFYLPWAGILKYEMKKRPLAGEKILAFGNPDLGNRQMDMPLTEAEVSGIRKIFPQTKIFLRAEATENKAVEMLDDYDIVHFAVRGFLNGDLPMNSGLQMSSGGYGDGWLTAAEIFKLKFRGRAIVMSNCRIAPGLFSNGMEVVLINRAFLYAGSPSVIATLWPVEDKAVAVFMEILYKNLKANKTVADSLRKTQAEMINRGYAPHHWAAFILTGIH